MFYRRKYYNIKSVFVEKFNEHFNKTNLPNQLKHGARLIGRWMRENENDTVEIFAIWEYDSYEDYIEIETKVRGDSAHVQRIIRWYDDNGGREHIYNKYILEVRNEVLACTINK
ncbi:NIPSNAP family protein [Sporosarcina sp. UB5]|uniref:NIPSNAP family protein n=1 Tax=Sporosarcina sp. UB5 TaxID=3047463 RepID=UPI003D7A30DF